MGTVRSDLNVPPLHYVESRFKLSTNETSFVLTSDGEFMGAVIPVVSEFKTLENWIIMEVVSGIIYIKIESTTSYRDEIESKLNKALKV